MYLWPQSEKNTAQASEEYDANWKRRKTSHDEEENSDKPQESQESNPDNANTPKKSDGEEKYDPLEADAESEEEEAHREPESEAVNEATPNAANGQEKTIDEMWTDADNDNDVEMGNLIDETDEKDHTEPEKNTMQKVERNLNPPKMSPRGGRGFIRGRGGPRARRSRR